ncbi:MAG: ATP-dependent DNA helicase RecG [Phycisphaerae bacterium]
MSSLRPDTSIQYVKGVGPRRAELFAALGIRTVVDLLNYLPFRHEIDHGEVDVCDLAPGMNATVRGEVIRARGRDPMFIVDIHDGSDALRLRWFQRPFAARIMQPGAMVVAHGPVREFEGELEMVQPSVSAFRPGAPLAPGDRGARLVGVYRGNDALKSQAIRRAVQAVLLAPSLPIDTIIPRAILDKRRLMQRVDAVRAMHQPRDTQALDAARRTLAYEELLLIELAMALRRRRATTLRPGIRLPVTREIDARIRARFPFRLTRAQDAVVREIGRDLAGGRPMTRLLQGDVGSGKTVVALYACLAAIAGRKQAAIMTPTEILADQHFRNIQQYLAGSRVRAALLRGGLSKRERGEQLRRVERGEIDLLVGTQALIQRDVAFADLALVVVDEQHKFGVLQRHEFRTKGPLPHYLVMTATPIPRTLAMTVFGDLDVSIIRELPPGRGKVLTRVAPRAKWETVMAYVRGRLERGEQAYVVCPLVGKTPEQAATELSPPGGGAPGSGAAARAVTRAAPSSANRRSGEPGVRERVSSRERGQRPSPELSSALQTHAALTAGPWAGLRVGLLHGGLPSAEKQAVIGDFSAGRLHAIVATTVVEVGVDVPRASIMVVDHAERFGLSQLHQLRGRVGRGAAESLCVLLAQSWSPDARQRLNVMAQTNDGFKIAEADLRLRGPGELFGTRQHGLPELHVASLADDFELLEMARDDAAEIVSRDPKLSESENAPLLPALRAMFGEKLALIDAA